MQFTIYSTTSCPYCKMQKDYLKEKNVPFTEKLVDKDDNAKNEMMKISGGFLGVPFSEVMKDDGSKDSIIGFDRGKIDGLLGL